MALREDASRPRQGSLRRALAVFVHLVISILRVQKVENIQRTMKRLCHHGTRAVDLIAC